MSTSLSAGWAKESRQNNLSNLSSLTFAASSTSNGWCIGYYGALPKDDFQGVFQGDVHGMGTLPASPAHMVPDSVFWDAGEGVVQGLNPQSRFFTVVLEGEMAVCAWVRHVPSTHYPWVIYLEDEARIDDRPVLLPHGFCQGEEEGFFGGIMRLKICVAVSETRHQPAG